MDVSPKLFLSSIIECFKSHPPESIIVGGSYSTGEDCRIQYNGCELWLSDFDLLCISMQKYSPEETQDIYDNMWKLSRQLPQSNPYFHIGMKLRTPAELRNEVNSMFFKELLATGLVIEGNSLDAYIKCDDVVGFHMLERRALHKKLYVWGLTRLWCNILFFPIKSILDSNWVKERIWYSYFVARGALDWITWQLIESNLWAPSYKKRFEIWESEFNIPEQTKLLLKKCLDIRLGNMIVDIEEIFSPVLIYSLNQIERYNKLNSDKSYDVELLFIEEMLHFIKAGINKDINFSLLPRIKTFLEKLSENNIEINGSLSWEYWHKLRVSYSNFRFKRSYIDWKDHNVYTDCFLKLGSAH